ncbi:MAG: 4-alpha-glucanotransferase [Gammaproteobacteria bacterium]|nr:4-alpha-glucanotransferase [Gammaproteobacteria bacterium]
MLDRRRGGILLHLSSLPTSPGNGDLGHQAYRFVEFLAASGMSVWQTLPLGPTHDDGSPYQCLSVHAGNPLLISLDWLRDRGWLDPASSALPATSPEDYRRHCLRVAHQGFSRQGAELSMQVYDAFSRKHSAWLDDYSLYLVLRAENANRAWMDWPVQLRDREPRALQAARRRHAGEIDRVRFEQFVFFEQWGELRDYAHRYGVRLFGDMPIFVAHDSAEVWAHREYFAIDEQGRAQTVAGVPPDYFSNTGQRWGNPHYRWDVMQADGFDWWVRRMATQLEFFDLIRIDHFRGFQAYWEIQSEAKTAQQGRWVRAPGKALLKKLHEVFDWLPLVAEDLGTITPSVDALRDAFDIPGMKILQFAFDGGNNNPYLPHGYEKNCVVYTGSHDNDTALSWYQALPKHQQHYVNSYLGFSQEAMPWPLIRCAWRSAAQLAIVPMQDILGLGAGQRMNIPGTTQGNWQWRYRWDQVEGQLAGRLKALSRLYGRC